MGSDSLAPARESEQEIMVLYQAEYMVGGTSSVAIESD
jgi:hypothetical protein